MKKILTLLPILLLVLCCKKDKTDADSFHVRCKVDGEFREFNAHLFAMGKRSGVNYVAVNGLTGRTPESDIFSLVIGSTKMAPPIPYVTAGTYTDRQNDFSILGALQIGSEQSYYYGGTDLVEQAELVDSVITNHFTITVTSIDDSTVRGNFSGELYAIGLLGEYDYPAPTMEDKRKVITEGSFYVPIPRP